MSNKKHKQKEQIEYKRAIWKTEIKGNADNTFERNIILWDFILGWILHVVIVLMIIAGKWR